MNVALLAGVVLLAGAPTDTPLGRAVGACLAGDDVLVEYDTGTFAAVFGPDEFEMYDDGGSVVVENSVMPTIASAASHCLATMMEWPEWVAEMIARPAPTWSSIDVGDYTIAWIDGTTIVHAR